MINEGWKCDECDYNSDDEDDEDQDYNEDE